jgi:hypothetical protein
VEPAEREEGIWGRAWKWLTEQLTVGPGADKSASARCPRAPIFDPKLGHGWVRADGPAVRGPVGSARWMLVFRPIYPVEQIRTCGVRLGRPAGNALRLSSYELTRTLELETLNKLVNSLLKSLTPIRKS